MSKISDFLVSIKNAGVAKHERVDLPSTGLRVAVAELLLKNGFVRSFKVAKDSKQGIIRLYLKYDKDGNHVIKEIIQVSKPGRRAYTKSTGIAPVRSGTGVVILSTSKGLMTGDEAKANKLGGELICKIW